MLCIFLSLEEIKIFVNYLSIFKDLRIEFYIFDIKLVENFEGY